MPDLEGQTYAAVDLGSNSFHMLVARYEHGKLHVIDRIKEMVRLAAGLGESGTLSTAARLRAMTTLTRFGERLRDIPQDNVRVVGTSTMRRIQQARSFLVTAETALGQPIEVISGHEEARLIFYGVSQAHSEPERSRLVIDIGGGSTELIVGTDDHPDQLESLDIGCVSMTRIFFPDGKISPEKWIHARTAAALEIADIVRWFPPGSWQDTVGSSGTARAIALIAEGLGQSPGELTQPALANVVEKCLTFSSSDDLNLPGLSDQRRPVIMGGLAILTAAFDVLKIEKMQVSDYALREGVLYDLLGRQQNIDPRTSSVASLAKRYHVDLIQADQVVATATHLFEQVGDSWRLREIHSNWLRWAANLHEIGLAIAHVGHNQHGAYLTAHSDMPGFSQLEKRILSHLIAMQRGKLHSEQLEDLPKKRRDGVARLVSILRLSIVLNRSRPRKEPVLMSARAERTKLALCPTSQWLEQNPLTAAGIRREKKQLSRIGVQFSLVTECHP